jgi:hypothetical protein
VSGGRLCDSPATIMFRSRCLCPFGGWILQRQHHRYQRHKHSRNKEHGQKAPIQRNVVSALMETRGYNLPVVGGTFIAPDNVILPCCWRRRKYKMPVHALYSAFCYAKIPIDGGHAGYFAIPYVPDMLLSATTYRDRIRVSNIRPYRTRKGEKKANNGNWY